MNSTVHPDPFQLGEDVGVSTRITPPSKFPFRLFHSSLPPPSSPKSLLLFVTSLSPGSSPILFHQTVPSPPLARSLSLSSPFPSSIPPRRLRQAPTSVTRAGSGWELSTHPGAERSRGFPGRAGGSRRVPSPLREACFQSSDRQPTAPAPPFQHHPFGN